jgi:hypothetical protein
MHVPSLKHNTDTTWAGKALAAILLFLLYSVTCCRYLLPPKVSLVSAAPHLVKTTQLTVITIPAN